MHLNQRGIIQIIPLIILLGGLVAGVYLVQQTQVFKSKATSNSIEWVTSFGEDPNNCVRFQNDQIVTTCAKVKFKLTPPSGGPRSDSGINLIKEALAQASPTLSTFTGKNYQCSIDRKKILEYVVKTPFLDIPLQGIPTLFGVPLEVKLPGLNWGLTEQVKSDCGGQGLVCSQSEDTIGCVVPGFTPQPTLAPDSPVRPIPTSSPTQTPLPSPVPTSSPTSARQLLEQRQQSVVLPTPTPQRGGLGGLAEGIRNLFSTLTNSPTSVSPVILHPKGQVIDLSKVSGGVKFEWQKPNTPKSLIYQVVIIEGSQKEANIPAHQAANPFYRRATTDLSFLSNLSFKSNTKYSWYVSAYDFSDGSADRYTEKFLGNSQITEFSVSGQAVVTSPTNLKDSAGGSVPLENNSPDVTLSWTNPADVTYYQIKITPTSTGEDVPQGIDEVSSVESSYTVKLPNFGALPPNANYFLLPDTTYTWQVRTTTANTAKDQLTESDWSSWSEAKFRTGKVSSKGIKRIAPGHREDVKTRTPTLIWANENKHIFLYEIQIGRGKNAVLYHETVHGGLSQPLNSYTIPKNQPLEDDYFYFWRVRPKVGEGGTPVEWSETFVFSSRPKEETKPPVAPPPPPAQPALPQAPGAPETPVDSGDPVNISPKPGETIYLDQSAGGIRFEWKGVPQAVRYGIVIAGSQGQESFNYQLTDCPGIKIDRAFACKIVTGTTDYTFPVNLFKEGFYKWHVSGGTGEFSNDESYFRSNKTHFTVRKSRQGEPAQTKKVTGYRFAETPTGLDKPFQSWNPDSSGSMVIEHQFADPANGPHFIFAQFQYETGEVVNANPYPLPITLIGSSIPVSTPPPPPAEGGVPPPPPPSTGDGSTTFTCKKDDYGPISNKTQWCACAAQFNDQGSLLRENCPQADRCFASCSECSSKTTCGQKTYEKCDDDVKCKAQGATASTKFSCWSLKNASCRYDEYPCGSCAVGTSSPTRTSCKMYASPSSGKTPLNVLFEVEVVDLSSLPDSKRSEWDLDGDGNYEIRDDVALHKNKTYSQNITSPLTLSPKFRVVAAPGSRQVLASCSTSVTLLPGSGGGGSSIFDDDYESPDE